MVWIRKGGKMYIIGSLKETRLLDSPMPVHAAPKIRPLGMYITLRHRCGSPCRKNCRPPVQGRCALMGLVLAEARPQRTGTKEIFTRAPRIR
jgi:hypothetical protein